MLRILVQLAQPAATLHNGVINRGMRITRQPERDSLHIRVPLLSSEGLHNLSFLLYLALTGQSLLLRKQRKQQVLLASNGMLEPVYLMRKLVTP